MIKSFAISFKTGLFFYKIKPLTKCAIAICASASDGNKRDKLFKMVQKMQTYNEN